MAAVAQVSLASVYGLRCSADVLNNYKTSVDPRIEGESHFLAAIHNANWGQRAELVQKHCARALELAPSLHTIMSLFLDSHIRRVPTTLCRSFDKLCQLGGTSAASLLFDSTQPTAPNFLNPTLIQAVVDALDSHQPYAPSYRLTTEKLLGAEHSAAGREVNLLDRAYSVHSYLHPLNQTSRAYYRAGGPISQFKIVCTDEGPVRLRLTYRIRHTAGQGSVILRLHGREVGVAAISRTWTTSTFTIPPGTLSPGFNILEIHWPEPKWELPPWIEEVATELKSANVAEACPVYGEIRSLGATACTWL
jgi:hypothetical protein